MNTTVDEIVLPTDLTVKNGDTLSVTYTTAGTGAPGGWITVPFMNTSTTATTLRKIWATYSAASASTIHIVPTGVSLTPYRPWGDVPPEIEQALTEALEECRGQRLPGV